jgi:hypothetical protein
VENVLKLFNEIKARTNQNYEDIIIYFIPTSRQKGRENGPEVKRFKIFQTIYFILGYNLYIPETENLLSQRSTSAHLGFSPPSSVTDRSLSVVCL